MFMFFEDFSIFLSILMYSKYWTFKLPPWLSIPVPAKPYGTCLSVNDFHVQRELFEVMLHFSLI